jgi:hypothetical protein
MTKPKPMLNGRELSEFDLAQIRWQLKELANIDVVSDEMRVLIESRWPDLASKLPPRMH